MVVPGKAARDQKSGYRPHGSAKHAALEHDWYKGGPAEKWLTADDQRISDDTGPPLKGHTCTGPGETENEDEPGNFRSLQSHDSVQTMHGERTVGIPARGPRVRDATAGGHQGSRGSKGSQGSPQ